jgi:hypothetical protein
MGGAMALATGCTSATIVEENPLHITDFRQNPERLRALQTRSFVVSDFMGNARKKSCRLSAGLRARALAAQDVAWISSPDSV